MADRPAAELVRAAGAVLWRPSGRGAQVAVIHRPKYDDWAFAKGKVDPGEHVLLAAVREVAEETGLRVTLGRRLPRVHYLNGGVPKRVDYWLARPEATVRQFSPTSEVDELAWLPASRAGVRLTYPHDVEILNDFRAGPRLTSPLILLRHASAGSKSRWRKDHESRPLDSSGRKDAEFLADLLRCFGRCRVVSSPAERCVGTVRPYAARAGSDVQIETALALTADASPHSEAQVAKIAAMFAADDRPVVICAHRENLPTMLEAACRQLGSASPAERPLRKGEFLVLHRAAGRLAAVERYRPADLG